MTRSWLLFYPAGIPNKPHNLHVDHISRWCQGPAAKSRELHLSVSLVYFVVIVRLFAGLEYFADHIPEAVGDDGVRVLRLEEFLPFCRVVAVFESHRLLNVLLHTS